ncbi:hypothetical protein PQC55_gp012 [Escherichia phage vB_EcoP-CHD5UKE1]|uniref:Uncharacterized protein n=2 Tax=Gordonclarkvirinae TaxID=3044644 RepID=A0AAE8C4E3_9CAUD|nr:hypothetical protein PQC43_gp014 [Escherichia phage vB_EcoP-101114UKE3]YP_010673918.1 hypothetical protein PQC55_gp012 [Escherichia phage vB_EcoP-CHD5UKE1]QZI79145.1 hypothetical protein 101114UKE3_014 [Escherichia phage vB_EcoP-101114UKE3]QZI80508.1 hypothetical protein CHD5UKE1_0012 [Escherichia phage vB_EcoP-CHD5UKE1]USM81263.1 hypothetical protein 101114BS3_136 [Escherichia phage vB_EcoP-101114BS3]
MHFYWCNTCLKLDPAFGRGFFVLRPIQASV